MGDNEEELDQEDAASSVASSANTANKPKSRRGGKNKKQNRNLETWKANNNPQGNKPAHQKQREQNAKFVPQNSKNKPSANQPKKVHQSKNVNQQKNTSPKPGTVGRRKVFVANVPSNATANDIKSPFMFCGAIVNIDVHSNKNI